MSLTALDALTIEQIFNFLEFDNIARLFMCGNRVLNAQLRARVKSFRLRLPKIDDPRSLADLFKSFVSICADPQSFDLEKDTPNFRRLDVAYLWHLLPRNLKRLSLPIQLDEQALGALEAFPTLEHLQLKGMARCPSPIILPSTLTSLHIGEVQDFLSPSYAINELLTNLPPQLETLVLSMSVGYTGAAPLNLRHLPLRTVRIGRIKPTQPLEWSFLPSTVTYLHICIERDYDFYGEHYQLPPSSWSELFPDLVHLATNYESLCLHHTTGNFSYDFPPSFTSLRAIGAGLHQGQVQHDFFVEKLVRLYGHSMLKLEEVYPPIELAMKYCPHLADIDLCKSSYSPYESDTESLLALGSQTSAIVKEHLPTEPLPMLFEYLGGMQRLTSLAFDWIPTSEQLRLLPRSLQSVRIEQRFGKETSSPYVQPSIASSDWPVNIVKFDLALRYHSISKSDIAFDWRSLPSTLLSLRISISYPSRDGVSDEIETSDNEGSEPLKDDGVTKRYPFLSGDLSFMKQLERLYVTGAEYDPHSPIREFELFSSHLELPSSLTSIIQTKDIGFSENLIISAHNVYDDTHYFQNLKQLKLGLLGDRYYGADRGMSTRLFYHLPPRLEEFEITCDSGSPGWSSHLIRALPRSLKLLHLFNAFTVKFDEDPSLALKELPPNLVLLTLMGGVVSEAYENKQLFSKHLPFIRHVLSRDLLAYDERRRAREEQETDQWMAKWKVNDVVISKPKPRSERPLDLRRLRPTTVADTIGDLIVPVATDHASEDESIEDEKDGNVLIPDQTALASPPVLTAAVTTSIASSASTAPSVPLQSKPSVAEPLPKKEEEPPTAFTASFLTSSPFSKNAHKPEDDAERDDSWD